MFQAIVTFSGSHCDPPGTADNKILIGVEQSVLPYENWSRAGNKGALKRIGKSYDKSCSSQRCKRP